MAEVYHALAYYHNHPRELSDIKTARKAAVEVFRASIEHPDGVNPDATWDG